MYLRFEARILSVNASILSIGSEHPSAEIIAKIELEAFFDNSLLKALFVNRKGGLYTSPEVALHPVSA